MIPHTETSIDCQMTHQFTRLPTKTSDASLRQRTSVPVLGIKVVVEVGLGLGVFAGDAIGIGNSVRELSVSWPPSPAQRVSKFIFSFLGLTPPAGCAVWAQIWEREDLIAFASSYHDSMLGLC